MRLLEPGRKQPTPPLYKRLGFWLWMVVVFIVFVLIVDPLLR